MITPTSETELRSELYFVLITESCVERVIQFNTQNEENNGNGVMNAVTTLSENRDKNKKSFDTLHFYISLLHF